MKNIKGMGKMSLLLTIIFFLLVALIFLALVFPSAQQVLNDFFSSGFPRLP